MNDTAQRILILRERIETAQRDLNRSEGEVSAITKRLKEEFGCSNSREAKAEYDSLLATAEEGERELEKLLGEIEEAINDIENPS